ncbi:1,4-dihydroxy-2-naphthoate polyprenyltransferase [Nesterenkonia sphaerica]|uniref:1,4-dihydroxy-2-naphthoate octaprenyltransferase n=1 Tax=Nesterenkonia sphaerica TaxID=1804988 RepID=A0A5R9A3J4_9MICC|nr:1,4-dihydroxy-2-naphthoate polyprenyltransferase [Nesterenkonia sphaerica]TLP72764.1 1,4-dihydroxy-2-naphthoate polyprenyltransferase [Nesterenkonia sphaerica]
MATTREWITGARPRTLPMAVCPVLIGAAAAWPPFLGPLDVAPAEGLPTNFNALVPVVAVLALIVALALQVGVNYANDYSDGVRGTDDVRVGPQRLTASQSAAPTQVKIAAFGSFAVAALAGLGVVVLTQAWWLLALGVLCVLAAWWYTGGSKPYGYRGLGEVMVFVFFGLVATLGTAFAITEVGRLHGFTVEFPAVTAGIGAVSHGLIASALLMANNVRDIPTDGEVGKNTLAVRLGQTGARATYCLMLALALALPLSLIGASAWFWVVVLAWPVALPPLMTMWPRRHPRPEGTALIPVLQQTGTLGLAFAAAFSAALLLSA